MGPAAALCAFCLLAGVADAGFSTPPHRLADREFLTKQTKVVDLLLHVEQPDNVTESFSLEENADRFQEPALARRLAAMDSRGFLKGRGQSFSTHRPGDIERARAVVELLLSASDFHTFYSTATWAKQRLSEALFSYAFTVAVLRRGDVTDVVLPAPYELWPQHFVDAAVLRRAYDAHLRGADGDGERQQAMVSIGARRSWSCPEERVSYFRADVGLNAHWLLKHLRCPFWLAGCARRGQLFYFALRQLAARYDLERLSVGMPPVHALRYPALYQKTYSDERFPNDLRCTPQDEVFIPDSPHVWKLKILEERIYDAIDAGYVVDRNNTEHILRSPEAIELLGNIIEGNADSINENFYGSLYRGLLTSFSHSEDGFPAKQVPTLMENPATALRDPLFYRAVKKLLEVFNRFQDRLGPYGKEELEFPGVRVEGVSVRRLSTHLERFQLELDNALPALAANASGPRLVALQRRLTARPFQYQLAVASQRSADVDALLRVYLGPRRRAGHLDTDRHRFVLFDAFRASLSPGVTTLRRSYKDLRFHGRPPLALSALRRRAMSALSSGWRLYVDDLARPLGGVERLALPRGRRAPEGLPLSLLVVISPAPGNNTTTNNTTAVSFPPRDGRPAAFPLDRPIAHDSVFDLPNIHFADVNIVHRG